jgi:hypothetical protein
LGSWLALFALAFQLAVSFGHVHLDTKGSGLALALAGAQAPTGADGASPSGSDETPAPADDYCAVCALIHLASNMVAAQAPALPVPALFGLTQGDPPAQFGLTARGHAPFAARAPPTA